MKRRCMLPMIFSVLVLTISACQKLPQAPIQGEKNEGQLPKAVLAAATSTETEQTETQVTMWQEQLERTDNSVAINFDAVVEMPEAKEIPVVSCKPHYFTSDEVKNVIDFFYGDAILYDNSLDTKENLEAFIIKDKANLKSLKESGGYLEENGEQGPQPVIIEDLQEEIGWLEDRIAQLEADYQVVSGGTIVTDKIEMKETDYGGESIIVRDNQTPPMEFYAVNCERVKDAAIEYDVTGHDFSAITPMEVGEQLDIATSREEAEHKALDAASACGITECKVVTVGKTQVGGQFSYVFTLGRLIGGVPNIPVHDYEGTTCMNADGKESVEPWRQENIQVIVNDEGAVGFRWEYPPEIIETINENTAIKTFDEIKETARTILPIKIGDKIPVGNRKDVTVMICEARLTMMRVANRGTSNEYYYLPVWDFIGYYGEVMNTKITEDYISATTCFLTLNAVDGSIIDRGLGY